MSCFLVSPNAASSVWVFRHTSVLIGFHLLAVLRVRPRHSHERRRRRGGNGRDDAGRSDEAEDFGPEKRTKGRRDGTYSLLRVRQIILRRLQTTRLRADENRRRIRFYSCGSINFFFFDFSLHVPTLTVLSYVAW